MKSGGEMKELVREVTVLIIDDNNAPFILPLIRCFSDLPTVHLDVLLFSERKPNYYRFSKYIRKIYHVKANLALEFEKGLRSAVEKSKAEVVIPTREWIFQKLSENRSWIEKIVHSHPVSEPLVLEMLTHKLKLNQWLKDHGFPHTRATAVTREIISGTGQDAVPFPLLLKPLKGAGGLGIKRVDNKSQLDLLLQRNNEFHTDYMLQQFIPGFDTDISFFAHEGKILFHTVQKAISNKKLTFPKSIQFHKDPRLLELAGKMAGKMNYTGIAHLDFRFDVRKEQYILVDFNARYWNSLQGSRLAGVNFPVLALAHTLGVDPGDQDFREGYFFYGTSAMVRILKNLFNREKIPFTFRNSQIPGILKDPLPEIMFFLSYPFRTVKRAFSNDNQAISL